MSGISGVLALGGGTPGTEELEPLMADLTRRGPDRARTWRGKGIVLGHNLLATTSESLVEELPLQHSDSGCTITGDIRLDNRGDLMRALGIRPDGRVTGDGELALHAYLKWGEGCAARLLGDFAFAIWDERQNRLYCARDRVGMRQFAYWHEPGHRFAFATDVDAVVCHPAVPKKLNLGRIADFLDALEACAVNESFFASVSKLAPAHWMTVDPERLRIERYWRPEAQPELRLKSDADYEAAFLDVFRAAVEARLRSANGVGCMLSGGLDSGSVVAIAAELLRDQGRGPLKTFSCIGPDPASCAETHAIGISASMAGISSTFIDYSKLDPMIEQLTELTRTEAEPFDCVMGLLRAAYLSASRAGIKVVLDGGGADAVFSAPNYVGRLIQRGQLLAAWREGRGHGRFWGAKYGWHSLALGAWSAFAPSSVRALRRKAMWWRQDRKLGVISRQFAERACVLERRASLRGDPRVDYLRDGQKAASLAHGNFVVGNERYDRVASSVGVEPRDPFMDLRIIEFGLSLPQDQLQRNGWPKQLMRRAVAGLVPDPVRWRLGKEHLGPKFTAAIYSKLAGTISDDFSTVVSPYVSQSWAKLPPEGAASYEDCQQHVDVISLYEWLKSHDCEFSR